MSNWIEHLASLGARFHQEEATQIEDFGTTLSAGALAEGVVAPVTDLGLIAVTGEDAASFLHNQLTNDVEHLGTNEARLAGYCTPKGRLQATFLMWRTGQDIFLALPRAIQPPLQKRLTMFVLRSKAKLRDATEEAASAAVLGLAGAKAEAALRRQVSALPAAPYGKVDGEFGSVLRLADALGAPRYLWITSAETAIAALPQLRETLALGGNAAWRLAEIHAGVPQVTQPTQEQFVPQMVNFELLGGVNFKKGCYPGQEIVARSQYLGKLKRRMTLATLPNAAARAGDNSFNPSISLVLGGTLSNLSQDPGSYRYGGFMPAGGETGPGSRGFNLGESELTMAANIDPLFAGQLTFALGAENEAEVEEAYVRTRELGGGWNLKAGRFLSGVGYLNGQHSHTWDFVDAPLAYGALFGGQYKPDGIQARWLAPLNTFLEVGAELGSGRSFPGNDRNKNGLNGGSVFAHVGDDIGDSSSWRAGLSWLRTGAADRTYEDDGIPAAFSGRSTIWVADAVYKWAPNGNPTHTNFKLQGEYLRRKESGQLAVEDRLGRYASTQSGWYLQGVYQFMPNWRAGLRHDRLSSGSPAIGLVDSGILGMEAFPALARYQPKRSSVMLDWSPSEFSRLRLQFARDEARPDAPDNQVFLQYIMSLGAHAGHTF